jgi:hypothetical protein
MDNLQTCGVEGEILTSSRAFQLADAAMRDADDIGHLLHILQGKLDELCLQYGWGAIQTSPEAKCVNAEIDRLRAEQRKSLVRRNELECLARELEGR